MRDGQLISTHKVQDLTKDQIITKMVGREMKDVYPVKTAVPGEIVLELKNLNKKVPLKTLIFRCARGRYWEWPDWLEPDGQRYSGLSSDWTSWTAVKFCMRENRSTSQNPDAIHAGIMMVSEDRKGEGLVLCRSVGENIALLEPE